jgi:tripartite-type tricarboxylate transporter receptor subunit TctC
LGVTTARRANAMPEVPSLSEAANLPDYDAAAWIGYAAPAGTPREVLVRIAGEIRRVLGSDDLKERYIALGLDPVSGTPDEMAAFMRREQDRYATIIRNANIKLEN